MSTALPTMTPRVQLDISGKSINVLGTKIPASKMTNPPANISSISNAPSYEYESESDDEYDDDEFTGGVSCNIKKTTAPTGVHPGEYFNSKGLFDDSLYLRTFIRYESSKSKEGGTRFQRYEKVYKCDKNAKKREALIENYNEMQCNDPSLYLDDLEMIPIMMERGTKKPLRTGWNKTSREGVDVDEWKRCDDDELNVAVLSGYASNIFVIDIDIPKEDEVHGLEWLRNQYEADTLSGMDNRRVYPGRADHYADTFVQESGSGGIHLFYEYEPICDIFSTAARNAVVENGKSYSIDIKSNGGNITMTPSLHKSGKKYQVLKELDGQKTHCVPKFMPIWLISSLVHLMQQNNYSFRHIRSEDIASFDNDGKCITPEMKFEKRATKKFDMTVLSDKDTVVKHFQKISKTRWDNYTDWIKMIILLSNLSRRSGDDRLYYKLACDLSASSSKWDSEAKKALDKRWDIGDIEFPYGYKCMVEWVKKDIGSQALYHEFLTEIGLFKRNSDYIWSDYSSLHDLDGQNKQDVDKVWDFMHSCIFPISGMSGGMVYLRKILSHDPLYDKEYVEYTASSTSQMKDILDNIKIRNAKEKLVGKEITLQDKSLMEYVKDYQIKNNYTKVVCTPYSSKSDNKAAAINKAKYKTYNLFSGLCNKYDPDFVIDYEFLAPAFNHIADLCDNKEDLTTYMIKWFAHVVQFPNVKTDTIWMIKSEQGVGKTMLFDWFGQSVLGKNYYFKTSDIEKVVGKFNSSTAGKLMVVLEEVDTFEGDHRIMNRLKDLSTGRLQSIEYKNRDAIMVEDYCNYAILTNRDYSVRIEKGDRRYICYESPRKYPVIDPHWDFMAAFFADPKSSEHFFHYLMGVEVHKSELRKIPETALRNEMKARNCHELVEYVHGLYDQLFFDDEGVRNDRTHIEFSNADALEGWAQVLRNHGRSNTSVDSRQVGIKMKSNFGDSYAGNGYVSARKMLDGVRDTIYTLSYDNIVRVLKDNGFNL